MEPQFKVKPRDRQCVMDITRFLLLISKFFSIYFTISGVKKIFLCIQNFVLIEVSVISKFHCILKPFGMIRHYLHVKIQSSVSVNVMQILLFGRTAGRVRA